MSSVIKTKITNKKIIILYYLNIFILTFYSLYKNGILLYNKGLINFKYIFKPLLLVLIAILFTYIVDYLYLRFIKNDNNYMIKIKNDYNPIYLAILTLCLPVGINIFLFTLIIIILSFLNNFIKQHDFNNIALYKILIILLLLLINKYNYLNVYELNVDTALTSFDMFLGRSIGGLGSTNTMLLLISFIRFVTIPSYKKEIPVSAFITSLLLSIVGTLFGFGFIYNIKELLNSEFLLAIIFVATIPEYSPIKEKDKIIFGILIGALSFIFNKIFNPFEGVFIAIILANAIFYGQRKLKKL